MTLSVENLGCDIGGRVILQNVTASIAPGEIVALIGPNGAGKTTLLNAISGLIRPSTGKIVLGGRSISGLRPTQIASLGVSRMFQSQHLAWNLTAADNVIAAIESPSFPSWTNTMLRPGYTRRVEHEAREAARGVLRRLNVDGVSATPARDLSHGQQRLIGLARALAYQANLLLLDEPLTGLKKSALTYVLRVLEEEAARGRALLITDHTLSVVRDIASRIWYMHKGRLTTFANYGALADSDLFKESYLGLKARDARDAKLQSLEHGTATVSAMTPRADDTSRPRESDRWSTLQQPERDKVGLSAPLVLSLRAVSAGYESNVVLRNINLELRKGDVLCVLGLNGCGKSTLLRAIAGAARVFGGEIWLGGKPIHPLSTDQRIREGLRMLPQDHRLFWRLSVADNLLLGTAALGGSGSFLPGMPLSIGAAPKRRVEAVTHALASELAITGDRTAGSLSGGEQARVSLSQLHEPLSKVILLDEPTAGIDGIARSELFDSITDWKNRGIPVLLVEHDVEFVLSVATRVAILRQGSLLELTSNASITTNTIRDALLQLNDDGMESVETLR